MTYCIHSCRLFCHFIDKRSIGRRATLQCQETFCYSDELRFVEAIAGGVVIERWRVRSFSS